MHLVSPGQDLHTSEMKTSKIREMLDVNVYLKLGGIAAAVSDDGARLIGIVAEEQSVHIPVRRKLLCKRQRQTHAGCPQLHCHLAFDGRSDQRRT